MINTPPLNATVPVLDDRVIFPQSWGSWFTQAWQILFAVSQSGLTADRPTTFLYIGRTYFDTDLGIPIWYDGTNWVDATGATV